MLFLEENLSIEYHKMTPYFVFYTVEDIFEDAAMKESGYSKEEIAYTVIQLSEGGYIETQFSFDAPAAKFGIGNILFITPKGHDFIGNIKGKETWSGKVRPALNALGGVSLSIIEAVSKGFATAAIGRLLPNGFHQADSE